MYKQRREKMLRKMMVRKALMYDSNDNNENRIVIDGQDDCTSNIGNMNTMITVTVVIKIIEILKLTWVIVKAMNDNTDGINNYTSSSKERD